VLPPRACGFPRPHRLYAGFVASGGGGDSFLVPAFREGKPGEPLSSIRRTRPRPGPTLALMAGREARLSS
jgi:hypothetical protein